MKLNKKTYIGLLLLMSGSLCCISCEDALTENPDSYYTREDFFTNSSNASLAITGIYYALTDIYGDKDGQGLPCSDDIYYPSGGAVTDNTRRDIGQYMLTSSNAWIEAVWKGKYEQLNRANYCIANIEQMHGYSKDDELKKLVAEAKFLRAQAALDLVRYWGDVPFKTVYSSDYQNAYQPRTDREEIYDQIVEDLNVAKEALPWADKSATPEKASQGAARALLMRALLARTGYSLQMDGTLTRPSDEVRKQYFKDIISEWEAFEENGYHGFYEGSYEALFRSFSEGTLDCKESLFEVAFYYPGTKGNWGTYNGPFVAAPKLNSSSESEKFMGRANGTYRVVPEWKSFFETDTKGNAIDQRRDVAVCTYRYNWDGEEYKHVKVEEKNGRNWYPGKWRREWMPIGYKDPNCTDVNYCLLRYADVVLMAAEAYNETGNTPKAWELLNKVRARAGATEVNSIDEYKAVHPNLYALPFFNNGGADDFRTALYWERGFELAFEGHRKYDLIRWGVLAEALQLFGKNTSVNTDTSVNYLAGQNFRKGKHELFPIPLDEMQVNFKLEGKNNPGY